MIRDGREASAVAPLVISGPAGSQLLSARERSASAACQSCESPIPRHSASSRCACAWSASLRTVDLSGIRPANQRSGPTLTSPPRRREPHWQHLTKALSSRRNGESHSYSISSTVCRWCNRSHRTSILCSSAGCFVTLTDPPPTTWTRRGRQVFFVECLLKCGVQPLAWFADSRGFFALTSQQSPERVMRQPTRVRFLSPIFAPSATHGHLPLGTRINSRPIQQHDEFHG